ncbi:substrate-binding domain-containing protein [Pelagibacterium flavum]|uniref:Substrate-binding domain-containing protein n=1 Tax=Pelagibacterium flavum TaxID=2984530 RepID=A0ABY6IJC1_9HYPH|nr:substrate-binding domain-containing protein [Pelagibacterium sp. YIM 151497]UYQ70697.1 substrate-binding domain-containing protein [Pelagibacterium sp. YIM 151497]|tara:strand:- start:6192 stop:7388 length:1197 start_codon:yes stop_codon:yes gene_type:complete
MKLSKILVIAALAAMAAAAGTAGAQDADPITIAHVYGKTGPLEAYATQSHNGLMLGLEYYTDGTMEIAGRPIEVIEKDTQLQPDIGRALLAEAYGDDEVDLAVGGVSSGVALAMLPVAEEYGKIFIVEPAVADSITGENWNRYIFRTGRNSSQDAVANAVALGQDDVKIATLAQDYAFGRDGVAAFREALESTGAELVFEEYAPQDTTDFTAHAQRIFDALEGEDGRKVIFVIWAGGGNPLGKIQDMDPNRLGIELATGGNILPALVAYRDFPGMEGATYYYYENLENPINDWLVEQHQVRFDGPPDFFTAGGFAAAGAIVAALEATGGDTDTETLISTMEGMSWDTPKGEMTFRPEDHQAMQDMFHFRIEVQDGVEWGVPALVEVIEAEEMDIPVRN